MVYRLWLKALKFEIKSHGRGFQAELARKVGLSPVYLNDILAGRKQASLMLQERIAECLGYRYEEMVAFGRSIIEDGSWADQLEKICCLARPERLDAVIELARKETGKNISVGQTLRHLYESGRLTEKELFLILLEQTGRSVGTMSYVKGHHSHSG